MYDIPQVHARTPGNTGITKRVEGSSHGSGETQPLAETHLLLLLQLVDHIRPEALPRLSDMGANKIADLAKVRGFILEIRGCWGWVLRVLLLFPL